MSWKYQLLNDWWHNGGRPLFPKDAFIMMKTMRKLQTNDEHNAWIAFGLYFKLLDHTGERIIEMTNLIVALSITYIMLLAPFELVTKWPLNVFVYVCNLHNILHVILVGLNTSRDSIDDVHIYYELIWYAFLPSWVFCHIIVVPS